MAVKGSATVTLSQYRDTKSVTRYYKLQSSSLAAPDKPANVKPNETPAGWSKSEPACDITKTLYTCDVTIFSDGTTYVSDVSKSTSYEAAKEAWNKANNAQGTANEAKNTATEAAKTADNYISADSSGIMVSENKGATKETPSNATKNNVLITEKDVQIRNGQKVVASYGQDTRIGPEDGSNISLSSDGVTVNDSGVKTATLKAIKNGWETIETRANFDGDSANAAMQSEAIWTCDYALEGEVSGVLNVYLNGPSVDSLPILSVSDAAYGFTHSGDIVTIRIDGSISLAQITDWAQYTSVTITYVKWKDVTGVVASDEIHGANGYIDNVYATNRILAGAQCDLVSVNDVKKVLIVGNGDVTKRANAAAIMQNGDIRLKGTVYFGCRKDSSGGKTIVDLIYPVGSIYMSVNSADPGTLFGGTWERIKDSFLLSAGDTYAAGTTGGSAKATLPSHTHTLGSGNYQLWGAKIGTGSTEPGNQISGDAKYYAAAKGSSASNYKWLANVDSKGVSDVSQANMPPYLAVYVWKRIY